MKNVALWKPAILLENFPRKLGFNFFEKISSSIKRTNHLKLFLKFLEGNKKPCKQNSKKRSITIQRTMLRLLKNAFEDVIC